MFVHKHSGMHDHTHETAMEARACTEEFDHAEWESKADLEAERRNERYFEEGPHGDPYVGSEEEARDRYLQSLVDRDWNYGLAGRFTR